MVLNTHKKLYSTFYIKIRLAKQLTRPSGLQNKTTFGPRYE